MERKLTDMSQVCQPRCAFKLFGKVNFVKKRNYKYG